jgi:hypothetical protein
MKTKKMTTIFTYKKLVCMKRFIQISGMAFLIMLFTGLRNTASAQPADDVSYQNFYDELSPYGRWIDYPEYGYVWCPDEGSDFRPYSTNGHWVWSDDYEWMWVSDYEWGWAPFHYGRWFYDDMYGWLWVPGNEWSPAWVAWRSGGDYYGWAPLRPGISINVGFSMGSYAPPVSYWCFAPCRYITSPRIYDYCVSPRQNVTIINNTTIINNYNYNRNVFVTGPRRYDAERFTHERIEPVRVRDISTPGRAGFRHNEVSIYRPSVNRINNNREIAPRRFDEYRGNNRVSERFGGSDRRDGWNGGFRRNENDNAGGGDRTPDRRNIFNNNERINGNNNPGRVENNRDIFQRRMESNNQPERTSPFGQRRDNPAFNRSNNGNDNGGRERSVRDVFGNDNRRGFDQPTPQPRFERHDQQPVRNSEVNPRAWNRDNGNRSFQNNNPQAMPDRRNVFERRDGSNNRGFNPQPQQQPQQRQSFPDVNHGQAQPRQFSQPGRGGNDDGNRGGWGRRRG